MASGAPRAATVRRQRYAAATWGRGDCDQVEVLATQGVDRYSTYVAHPGIASTWIYTMGASTSPIRISLRTQFRDRKRVETGKGGSGRVELGGRRKYKKKKK